MILDHLITRNDRIVVVFGRYCISLAFVIILPEVLLFFKTFLRDLSFDVCQGCEGVGASVGEFCRTSRTPACNAEPQR